jgi:hypothetical protein
MGTKSGGLVCELFDNNVRKLYYYELVETAARNVLSTVLGFYLKGWHLKVFQI